MSSTKIYVNQILFTVIYVDMYKGNKKLWSWFNYLSFFVYLSFDFILIILQFCPKSNQILFTLYPELNSHRNHNHQILRIVHHQTKHFKVNSFNLVILFKLICEVRSGNIVFPDFLWTNLVREFNSSWALFCPLESLFLLKLSLFVEPVMIFQNRTKTSA